MPTATIPRSPATAASARWRFRFPHGLTAVRPRSDTRNRRRPVTGVSRGRRHAAWREVWRLVVLLTCKLYFARSTLAGPSDSARAARSDRGQTTSSFRSFSRRTTLLRPAVTVTPAMALLSLRGAAKSFGSRLVLDGLDFDVEAGARVGVIGPNGGGKSTLLRILDQLEEPDAGELTQRRGLVVAFVPQQPEGDARDALATARAARPDLARLEAELSDVEQQLGSSYGDLAKLARLLERQEKLIERWTAAGGPGFDGRARALFVDVGLDEADLAKPTRLLSGGQRKLVALAAALLRDPDVLLLDEPEAHLDVSARERLESAIGGFDGAVVTVSHDRYLLDETVSTTAELNGGRVRVWPGNYSAYTVARELELQRQ